MTEHVSSVTADGPAGNPGGGHDAATASGGCCGGSGPAVATAVLEAAPCCGTSAEARADGACCGTSAKAESVASGGCGCA